MLPPSQEIARKWEKSARESSYTCNQATGFNGCITKLQEEVQGHVKILKELAKGKGSQAAKKSVDEQMFAVCDHG